jgi:hypothetical protein
MYIFLGIYTGDLKTQFLSRKNVSKICLQHLVPGTHFQKNKKQNKVVLGTEYGVFWYENVIKKI